MQQDLGARCRKAPGGQNRLALLTGADAFGDAVDKQIGDLVFAKIARGELLVVRPQPLADLADHGLRQSRQEHGYAEKELAISSAIREPHLGRHA